MIVELLPPETVRAFDAVRVLRPNVGASTDFVHRVDVVQRPGGYRIVAAVGAVDDELDGGGPARAVAGFRLMETLASGRILYIDDLSTLPEYRRQGLALELLTWVFGEAGRLGCGQVHLDSGVGPQRFDAHRLYHSAGFSITSHHFAAPVPAHGFSELD